jgi:hypothetical protein
VVDHRNLDVIGTRKDRRRRLPGSFDCRPQKVEALPESTREASDDSIFGEITALRIIIIIAAVPSERPGSRMRFNVAFVNAFFNPVRMCGALKSYMATVKVS